MDVPPADSLAATESPTRGAAASRGKSSGRSVALALVPVLGLTLGIPFANHVEPRVFGLPFLPVYIVGWIVATPAFLFVVYRSEGRG